MEYLHTGYGGYQEKVNAALSSGNEMESFNVVSSIAKIMSVSYTVARMAIFNNEKSQILSSTTQIMQSMEGILKLTANNNKGLVLKANLMVVRSCCPAGYQLKFSSNTIESHQKFLTFERYSNGNGIKICLPMPDPSRPDCALPGAPEATLMDTDDYSVMNCSRISYRKGVPKTIRKEIEKYFLTATYKSLISLPLCVMHSGAPEGIGVVNIESNRGNVLGEGAHKIPGVAKILSPLCLILATLVHAENTITTKTVKIEEA